MYAFSVSMMNFIKAAFKVLAPFEILFRLPYTWSWSIPLLHVLLYSMLYPDSEKFKFISLQCLSSPGMSGRGLVFLVPPDISDPPFVGVYPVPFVNFSRPNASRISWAEVIIVTWVRIWM